MPYESVTNDNLHYFSNEVWKTTENIRNEIHTNLTEINKNVNQPSLSKCTVYCGYNLENIFLKSQRYENWIRCDEWQRQKSTETLVHESKKSQAHRLSKMWVISTHLPSLSPGTYGNISCLGSNILSTSFSQK